MKCQNCGKNEANFYYSSNINGHITESNLCAECVEKMGYEKDMLFGTDEMFNNMLPGFFGRRHDLFPYGGFMITRPAPYQREQRPDTGIGIKEKPDTGIPAQKAEIDPEMQKRRELNLLREQMRAAAETEDFEKAAQIRDSIREMDGNEAV